MNKTWYDSISKPLAEFLTSTLFVILVMLAFMAGIVTHLADVFDSWFLSIGFQCVVVIASVNSEILPKITVKSEYQQGKLVVVKSLPGIAVIMSVFMLWFISISFGVVDNAKAGDWTDFTIGLTKAIATASMELMFSYLFTSRWNTDLKRFAGLRTSFEQSVIEQIDNDKISELNRIKQRNEILSKFSNDELKTVDSTITKNTTTLSSEAEKQSNRKSSGGYLFNE